MFLSKVSLDWKKNINDLRLKRLSPSEKIQVSKKIAELWLKIEKDVFLGLNKKLKDTSISLIKVDNDMKDVEKLVRTEFKLKSTYYIINNNKDIESLGKNKISNELDILLRRQTVSITNSLGEFEKTTDLHRNFNKYDRVVRFIYQYIINFIKDN